MAILWFLLGVLVGSIGTGIFAGRITTLFVPQEPIFLDFRMENKLNDKTNNPA